MMEFYKPINNTLRTELSSYDDLTAALLSRRGVCTAEEAETFLHPSYELHTHDPFLMNNMPTASERLANAIDANEYIAVWSDYDADGIPGGVILHDFLKKINTRFINYIPHRHLEGYGINIAGVEKLADAGVSLIITVDSGITDVHAIARAKELNVDVIITDHHEIGESVPEAFTIVDPKQKNENYPFRDLCGAALAWKLVVATLARGFAAREQIPKGWEKWLLDMVGFATIADMVPLRGENRVLAKYGLMVLRKSPRKGVIALCRTARLQQQTLSEDDIAFSLAPRINAASRMGDPMDAFRLFTTDDESEANELAKKLEAANRRRRSAAGAITRSIHSRLSDNTKTALSDIIVMGDPDWHPELLGIVATTIAQENNKPVFLWGRGANNLFKGSCRSDGATHMLSLMSATKDVFIQYGGHAAAGGFTVNPDMIFSLEKHLITAYRLHTAEIQFNSETRADEKLSIDEVTNTLLEDIEPFSPFGEGNPKPIWMFRDVIVDEISWFGKNNEHARLILHRAGKPLEAIAFFVTRALRNNISNLTPHIHISMLAYVERDTFLYRNTTRLRIISIS